MQNITYQLIADGNVVDAGNVAVPDRKYHVLKFKATYKMVPKSHLIVYRFVNGWIASARPDISIEDDLKNSTKPYSYIDLEITKTNAMEELDGNLHANTTLYSISEEIRYWKAFVDCNVIFFTNAYHEKSQDSMPEMAMSRSARPPGIPIQQSSNRLPSSLSSPNNKSTHESTSLPQQVRTIFIWYPLSPGSELRAFL